jgi:molecular chaperone DnaK (HSP70)
MTGATPGLVSPASIVIEGGDGVHGVLLLRGTPVPASRTLTFTTTTDNQERIDFPLVVGESIARFELSGLPPAPAGVPQIELTVAIDDGLNLRISAREIKSGHTASMVIRL